jgi:hypothetical protein
VLRHEADEDVSISAIANVFAAIGCELSSLTLGDVTLMVDENNVHSYRIRTDRPKNAASNSTVIENEPVLLTRDRSPLRGMIIRHCDAE